MKTASFLISAIIAAGSPALSADNHSGVFPTLIPKNKYFSAQWYLYNRKKGLKIKIRDPGSNRNSNYLASITQRGIRGSDIRAPEAWKITTGSPDVVVAILDSGINFNHIDLKHAAWAKIIDGKTVNGFNCSMNSKNKYDVEDKDGHGTKMAGIVAARMNLNKGEYSITGIAPNVKLMALKTGDGDFDKKQASLNQVFQCMEFAKKNGADILLISSTWGENPSQVDSPSNTETNLRSYFRNRWLSKLADIAGAGISIVVAAGNSSQDALGQIRPGKHLSKNDHVLPVVLSSEVPGMVAVGNSDSRDLPAFDSNRGRGVVQIFAPGTDILTTVGCRKSETRVWGTSFAAPMVAAGIALLKSIEPTLSPEKIKERLIETADPRPALSQSESGGRLNLIHFLLDERVKKH